MAFANLFDGSTISRSVSENLVDAFKNIGEDASESSTAFAAEDATLMAPPITRLTGIGTNGVELGESGTTLATIKPSRASDVDYLYTLDSKSTMGAIDVQAIYTAAGGTNDVSGDGATTATTTDNPAQFAKDFYASTWKLDGSSVDKGSMLYVNGVQASVLGGQGDDRIDVSGALKGSSVQGGAGNDTIVLGTVVNDNANRLDRFIRTTLAGGAAGIAYLDADAQTNTVTQVATGIVVDGGAGADVIQNTFHNTINAGDGDDTIESLGENVINTGEGNNYVTVGNLDTVTLGTGDGDDTIDMRAATLEEGELARVTSYHANDYLYVDSIEQQLGDYTKHADNFAQNGRVYNYTTTRQGGVQLDYNVAGYQATLTDGNDKHVAVYFGSSVASTLKSDSNAEYVYMIGSNNEDAGDRIQGGTRQDTIVAGMNDTVNGGAGNDSIQFANTAPTGARYVEFNAASGNDTVYGFTAGLGAQGDVVSLIDGVEGVSAGVSGTNIVFSTTDSSGNVTSNLTLQAAASNLYWKDADDIYAVRIKNGDTLMNTAVVAAGAAGYVTGDVDADFFLGSNSKLDYTKSTADTVVDLSNSGKYTSVKFSGFSTVEGSNGGKSTIVGAANTNNLLIGGKGGANFLYGGGASDDKLQGMSSQADTFEFGIGDGNDTVTQYQSGQDIVYAATGGAISGTRTATKLTFDWDGGKTLTVVPVSGTSTDVNTSILYTTTEDASTVYSLKMGMTDSDNAFAYSANDKIYYGGSKTDTLSVTGSGSQKVWFNGAYGQNMNGIEVLDASQSSGNNELAGGNNTSETILGGNGADSLWGGAGSVNDVMVGGNGANTFYFGNNEGNDVITSYNDGDKVMLYNVGDAQIASAGMVDNNMVITLKDNSTLTIAGYGEGGSMSFQTANSTYTYDKVNGTWNKA